MKHSILKSLILLSAFILPSICPAYQDGVYLVYPDDNQFISNNNRLETNNDINFAQRFFGSHFNIYIVEKGEVKILGTKDYVETFEVDTDYELVEDGVTTIFDAAQEFLLFNKETGILRFQETLNSCECRFIPEIAPGIINTPRDGIKIFYDQPLFKNTLAWLVDCPLPPDPGYLVYGNPKSKYIELRFNYEKKDISWSFDYGYEMGIPMPNMGITYWLKEYYYVNDKYETIVPVPDTPFEWTLDFDFPSTDINISESESQPEIIYDLAGRRLKSLESAQKGIYIVNGEKIAIKN